MTKKQISEINDTVIKEMEKGYDFSVDNVINNIRDIDEDLGVSIIDKISDDQVLLDDQALEDYSNYVVKTYDFLTMINSFQNVDVTAGEYYQINGYGKVENMKMGNVKGVLLDIIDDCIEDRSKDIEKGIDTKATEKDNDSIKKKKDIDM